MRGGVVDSPPYGDRSSVGVAPEGALDVRRVEFFGTWRGLGQRRTLNDLNQTPGPNAFSLFTPSYGATTPAQSGTTEVVISPFPPATPNTDLSGPVIQVAGAGGTPIPRDGAVLVARGTAAARLAEEAPVGTGLTVRLIFRPDWTGITDAVGGGPVLVRNGGPVFRANEAFTSSQLAPRNPRTGVGQLADGRIVLVVVDGRRPGYSVGMTNFELAQTLVRLGAVTGSALDGGGSSTLAFDGTLLNRPSDPGGERPSANALQLMYYGVYCAAPEPVVSPNGDGFAERQRALTYKLVRPSTVSRDLVGPERAWRRPPRAWASSSRARTRSRFRRRRSIRPDAALPGRGSLASSTSRPSTTSSATSSTAQSFTVNNTLGFARLSRRSLVVRVRGQADDSGRRHAHPAGAGDRDRRDDRPACRWPRSRSGARRQAVSWRPGAAPPAAASSLVYGGMYVVRFRATNELGAVDLVSPAFRVIRAAPLPVKKPTPKG